MPKGIIQVIECEYSIKELKQKLKTQTELDQERKENKKSYVFEDTETSELEGEHWQIHPEGKYEVSTLGRIKYNNIILSQADIGEKPGWLVIKDSKAQNGTILNNSKYIYTFVAETFLGKVTGDGYEVHHITNDGYDNSVGNLILLTKMQHNEINRK